MVLILYGDCSNSGEIFRTDWAKRRGKCTKVLDRAAILRDDFSARQSKNPYKIDIACVNVYFNFNRYSLNNNIFIIFGH